MPCTLFVKGLYHVPGGLKVSRTPIANMILFVNASNFLKWKLSYIMKFDVAYWDTWDNNYAF